MSNRILVVDDDLLISRLIEFNLRQADYNVHCVYDGQAVFEAIKEFRPNLIVLDLMLPIMDGLEVCRRLRGQHNHTPIIMLTALVELSDTIMGLDNGADDYMKKPFSPQELISRIKSILRRADLDVATNIENTIQIGDIHIIPDQREVMIHGNLIDLTPKEFELLLFLCKHRGKVLSRQQLLYGVWGYHFFEDTRVVDVHISHLREKLEVNTRDPEYIITVRNVGYKLKDTTPLSSNAAY